MDAAADGVVLYTAIPLAVMMIADGLGGQRAAEIGAGLVVAALVGVPMLLIDLRARLRAKLEG
jgi:hypothetical protein